MKIITIALAGILTGTTVYAGLLAAGYNELWNVHAGVIALLVNLAVCTVVSRARDTSPLSTRATTQVV